MIVSHIFAKTIDLEPIPAGDLYQYVVAANGVFLRAERPGLKVQILFEPLHSAMRGLVELKSFVLMTENRVPARITARMVELAYQAGGREILYYLEPLSYKMIQADTRTALVSVRPENPWRLHVPEQIATPGSVKPVRPDAGADALIEVHSHHAMMPFFSSMDDHDEQGVRLYAVLGNLKSSPMIYTRVGVYGQFCAIPANLVFNLPVGLVDIYMEYDRYGD